MTTNGVVVEVLTEAMTILTKVGVRIKIIPITIMIILITTQRNSVIVESNRMKIVTIPTEVEVNNIRIEMAFSIILVKHMVSNQYNQGVDPAIK